VSVFLKHGKREWLGQEFTEKFAAELSAEPEVDICGERGEYHSFAFDGPLFREELPATQR
jgi:diphthamide synthase (EF-2-diphthine--ammonia ligase)